MVKTAVLPSWQRGAKRPGQFINRVRPQNPVNQPQTGNRQTKDSPTSQNHPDSLGGKAGEGKRRAGEEGKGKGKWKEKGTARRMGSEGKEKGERIEGDNSPHVSSVLHYLAVYLDCSCQPETKPRFSPRLLGARNHGETKSSLFPRWFGARRFGAGQDDPRKRMTRWVLNQPPPPSPPFF